MMKKLLVLVISLLTAAQAYSQDGFGGIFDSTDSIDESQSNVILNGEIGFDYTSYLDANWDSERIIIPYANLNLLFA